MFFDWKNLRSILFLTMNPKLQCIIILGAAIAGISTVYWLQAAINNERTVTVRGFDYKYDNLLGINWDKYTFGMCIITSIVTIPSIVLIIMKDTNRLFGKISFGLTLILCVLWTISLIVYSTRKCKDNLDCILNWLIWLGNLDDFTISGFKSGITLKDRRRDIVRSIVYIVLSGTSVLLHALAGLLKA